jgi:clan AA aspartic protease
MYTYYGGKIMGMVYTEIILKNAGDEIRVADGHLKEQDIRQMTVRALVDTGASDMVIDEDTRARLGLRIAKQSAVTFADGSKAEYQVTEPIKVCWKDRDAISRAVVLPHADEVLLGALPLEGMDLMVHPKTQEVVGVHGDKALFVVYSCRGSD